MESSSASSDLDAISFLGQIQKTLETLQLSFEQLSTVVDTVNGRINALFEVAASHERTLNVLAKLGNTETVPGFVPPNGAQESVSIASQENKTDDPQLAISTMPIRKSNTSSRIILTTYPGQSGIDPLNMNWGHKDPMRRGPVVVSRNQNTLRRRNGMYCSFTDSWLALTL